MSSDSCFTCSWRLRSSLIAVACLSLLLGPGVTISSRADDIESKFSEQAGSAGKMDSSYSATVGDDGEISIVSKDEIELKTGSALIEARNLVTVTAGNCKAIMKKGALALFRMEGDMVRCFVLLGSAKVHAGQKVHVSPVAGTEVVLSDHNPDDHELLYRDELGRRAVTPPSARKVDDKLFLVTSEFSVIQALDREPLVYSLAHSKNPRDKALKFRLMKTAAVLNMVTSHRGHYATGR